MASSRRGWAVRRSAGRMLLEPVFDFPTISSSSSDSELPRELLIPTYNGASEKTFQPSEPELGSISAALSSPVFVPPREETAELDFSKPWKMSDLVLSVEERKLHVHKAILAISSPVFEAMLSSNFKEKNEKEIPLPGKKVEEMEELLRAIYPYCKHVITRINCCSLLELSCEYQMDELKERCEKFVLDTYRSQPRTLRTAKSKCNEALQFVSMAQRYQLRDEVVQRCISLFVSQQSSWDILKTNEFFCQLESQYRQRVLEERVKFLENRLDTCSCKGMLPLSSDEDTIIISSPISMVKRRRISFKTDRRHPPGAPT